MAYLYLGHWIIQLDQLKWNHEALIMCFSMELRPILLRVHKNCLLGSAEGNIIMCTIYFKNVGRLCFPAPDWEYSSLSRDGQDVASLPGAALGLISCSHQLVSRSVQAAHKTPLLCSLSPRKLKKEEESIIKWGESKRPRGQAWLDSPNRFNQVSYCTKEVTTFAHAKFS